MTIEDVRSWVKKIQPDIYEGKNLTTYNFYAMVLKHYTVTYLDRFGVALDTNAAYMHRNESVAEYKVNQNYETNDEDYHFKGWVTEQQYHDAHIVDYPNTL